MTKKQLKKMAVRIAHLEQIIQKNEDAAAVAAAKEEMLKFGQSGFLSLNDLVQLDAMTAEILKQEKI